MESKNERKRLLEASDEIGFEEDDDISMDDDVVPQMDIISFFESLALAWLDKNGLKILVNQIKKKDPVEEEVVPVRKGCVMRRK